MDEISFRLTLPREIQQLLAWFGKNTILGLPADIVAHFAVGALLAAGFAIVRARPRVADGMIMGAALAKELLVDPAVYGLERSLRESTFDLFFTYLGVLAARLAIFFLRRGRRTRVSARVRSGSGPGSRRLPF